MRDDWTDEQYERVTAIRELLQRLDKEIDFISDDEEMSAVEAAVMHVLGTRLMEIAERLVTAPSEELGLLLDDAEILMNTFETEVREIVRNHS